MAKLFLTSIDLAKNELLNARVQNLSTSPSSPVTGQIYYDTDDNILYFWNGASWRSADAAAAGVPASTWNANTLVKADTDDNPVAFTVAEQTLVGRVTGGVIDDLSITDVKTLLSLSDIQIKALAGAMVTGNTETGIVVTYQSADDTLDFVVNALNLLPSPTGDLSLATFKITNLGTPTASSDAATKGYVDAAVNGLNWKDEVRAASTANGTLASAFENGDTLDGVTLATGDRILLKNQSSATENGIYTVNASGAPTRSTDADTGAEILQAAVFVSEGTANADTAWLLTTNAPITLGSTSLTFVQFGAGATYTAGNGLTLTANDFSVNVDNSSIEINADTLRIKAAGVTDAMLATAYSKHFTATVGDGVSTSIAVTHSLGSKAVEVAVYRTGSPYDEVEVDVFRNSTSQVTLGFVVAPTSAEYTVVVEGR